MRRQLYRGGGIAGLYPRQKFGLGSWFQDKKDKAVDEIKTRVVDLTFAITEKIIKKNISSKENQNLIEESLEGLDKYSA